MDANPDTSSLTPDIADARARTLRIAYGSRCAGRPAALFAEAAACGFSHVMLPPPWPAARQGDAFVSQDFSALSPDFGDGDLGGLAGLAGAAGVALLLDVVLDRISSSSSLLADTDCPFAAPDAAMLLDPRRSLGGDVARARLATEEDARGLADWWARRLAGWHRAGMAGFRLLGLAQVPPALVAMLFGALRRALPAPLLLPWTPGLPRGTVASLRGLGADAVFASLPWWDGQAPWLWDEIALLSGIAPVLGLDGSPPGPGHQAPRPSTPRSRALAPLLGQGWMHTLPAHADGAAGDRAGVARINALLADEPALASRTLPALPAGTGGRMVCLLRTDAADHRSATRAVLALINTDGRRAATVSGADILPATGGRFAAFTPSAEEAGAPLTPATRFSLKPGDTRIFTALAAGTSRPPTRATRSAAQAAGAAPRLAIENPTPSVDGGAFPVKAIAGELVGVEADVVFDGHDKIAAALRWRHEGGSGKSWQEVAMIPLGNDRWRATFPLADLGRHVYVVAAWRDRFATFRDELAKKSGAGVPIGLELREGEALIQQAAARSSFAGLSAVLGSLAGADEADRLATLLSDDLASLMAEADDRPFLVETPPLPVDAERIEARFASWYEVFPRSLSDDPHRHGTFADVERHLPRIAGMGFDVLYFPPISPIGRTNRKGRNNSLTAASEDPGSPYAVGSADGGHDALHPELGTLEDFAHLRAAAAAHGLELAIDFAIQCSPDHPWLKQHPGWFDWRPDGSIRYAENPPKKYEDIVNVDFYAADAVPDLWMALCDVVLFWAEQGVRLFRVDNPHTKPFPFWEWMIGAVRRQYPDAIFLAEAFTRPKVMYRLGKIGFSQSYTYFTWRNSKRELEAYLTDLNGPPRDFFRPHFFVNTPDINPPFLQVSGRPGFLIRAALATTLSGLWGVYNGFELCEAEAVPGKEEYLDSEKYQLRAWDWDRPGHIIAEITALNRIRRQNPALQTHLGITFHNAFNDAILYYEKATPDRSNVVLVAVNLDPARPQEADFEIPLWSWQLPDSASLAAEDLLSGERFTWTGKRQHMRLTQDRPYAIWRVRPAS